MPLHPRHVCLLQGPNARTALPRPVAGRPKRRPLARTAPFALRRPRCRNLRGGQLHLSVPTSKEAEGGGINMGVTFHFFSRFSGSSFCAVRPGAVTPGPFLRRSYAGRASIRRAGGNHLEVSGFYTAHEAALFRGHELPPSEDAESPVHFSKSKGADREETSRNSACFRISASALRLIDIGPPLLSVPAGSGAADPVALQRQTPERCFQGGRCCSPLVHFRSPHYIF